MVRHAFQLLDLQHLAIFPACSSTRDSEEKYVIFYVEQGIDTKVVHIFPATQTACDMINRLEL